MSQTQSLMAGKDRSFSFADLFVLDLANNHQGRVAHAARIIAELGDVVRRHGARAALKFQFRQLDTFIHPAHKESTTNKHIPRFLSTALSQEDYEVLSQRVSASGLVTMATPFDEPSVDVCTHLGIEVLKVASCSAADWPLLERISEANKPVIVSTGGLSAKQIDDLVSFFEHRRTHFAIMHCVAIYPTPADRLELNQIELLCRRYPGITIGYSTHEPPDDTDPVQVAVAKGARILERHVGIETDDIKLNAYSSTPAQIDRWLGAARKTRAMCGAATRQPASPEESASLQSLWRGVYARNPLKSGVQLERDDVYFAMPYVAGQLSSGEWKDGLVATTPLDKDAAVMADNLSRPAEPEKQVLFTAIHSSKAMLNEARIALPVEFETEFSHHYGIGRFETVGIIMITCVNRSYCKKLVIQLSGQRHPSHYHKQKEETFQVLYGVLEMQIEGRRRTLYPGDTQLVQQGVWHEFWTDSGTVFEEISTTHVANDSFYEDKTINERGLARKTVVNQWGRYQI
jgi:sialic acid synthase SpsE/mannose-6-phosphate isomerase-like protein (cupin superfamily)